MVRVFLRPERSPDSMHLADSEVHTPDVVVFNEATSRTHPTSRAQGRSFMVSLVY